MAGNADRAAVDYQVQPGERWHTMPAGLEEPAEQSKAVEHLHETINKGLDSTPYTDLSVPTGVGQDGTLNALDSTASQGGTGEPPPEIDD